VTGVRLAPGILPAAILGAWVTMGFAGELPKQALAQANTALQAGRADEALALLKHIPNPGAGQSEANNLECRVLYSLEQWNGAVEACEQAVKLDPENSNYHLWLGRALGEKANNASFLSAFSIAKRVREEFEEAVRLNPRNSDALADLGNFYRSAPGIVGGGLDKAERIARQLDSVDAARADELRGQMAEERKDWGAAEREYKLAITVSAHPAFRWTTLADFYRRRQQWTQMEDAVQGCVSAAERDKGAGVPRFDLASLLLDANRDLPLAAKMLEEYLAGPAKTEEAPAFLAFTRLAQVDQRMGDLAGAKREQAEALALAREYRPAQDLSIKETGH